MPKFTVMDPDRVQIGRERSAAEALRPFIDAIGASDAGRIELDDDEVVSTVKRRIADAARANGVSVRSSLVGERTIEWKKMSGGRRPPAKREINPEKPRAAAKAKPRGRQR